VLPQILALILSSQKLPATHALAGNDCCWATKSKSRVVFETQVSFLVCLKKQIHFFGLGYFKQWHNKNLIY
jgi:hypothetical protein